MKTLIPNCPIFRGTYKVGLADNSGVSRVLICKYECGEAAPSIDAAKKITDALATSLNHLARKGLIKALRETMQRQWDLAHLEEEKKKTFFVLIDNYIRYAKARKPYEH